MDDILKEKGFDNFDDFFNYIKKAQKVLSEEEFNTWKLNDGTKEGLLFLIGTNFSEDVKDVDHLKIRKLLFSEDSEKIKLSLEKSIEWKSIVKPAMEEFLELIDEGVCDPDSKKEYLKKIIKGAFMSIFHFGFISGCDNDEIDALEKMFKLPSKEH